MLSTTRSEAATSIGGSARGVLALGLALTLPLTLSLTLTLTLAVASSFVSLRAGGEASAQEPRQAGLVVQLSEDDVRELCIALTSDGMSGIELLRASGLSLRAEESSMGAMVCQVEDAGCPEGKACMCECETAGGECSYWAYNILVEGAWTYSEVGASDRVVRHGDVDAWAWGSGSETGGPVPPVRTFDELCGAVPAEDEGGLADGEEATGTAPEPEGDGRGNTAGYLMLVAVVAALAGVWLWPRRR